MWEKLSSRKEKLERINEAIQKREDNIIYVDFVFLSMYNSIDGWYKKYYQDDPHGLIRKGHLFLLTRLYSTKKFGDYSTIGQERDKLLEKLDRQIQMRRNY